MDVKTTRQLIAQRIEETGITCYWFQPDNFVTPCAIVRPADSGPIPATFDNSIQAPFVVALVSGSNDAEDSQTLLDEWLTPGHPTSMVDAIELGGGITVTEYQNYGAVPVGGVRYFAVELLLEVWG